MEKLKDVHKNKECVVLTCGPSLTEYPKDIIKNFLKDKIVICVKESILEYKDQADYFIDNGMRHRAFDFNEKTIKIYQDNGTVKPLHEVDISLHEDRPWNGQLLQKHNFDQYNFDNQIKRPWGPGILYETAFYLCLYMGITNVYTIGWDLIDTKTTHKITHYFDDYESLDYNSSKRWGNKDYLMEMKLVNNNIPHFYDYLKEKGMNLFVMGKQSYVNEHIPRKYL